MIRAGALLTLLGLLGTGCAAPGPLIAPLPPGSAGVERELRQRIIATAGDRSVSLQTLVRSNSDELLIVALSDLGQRLFTLRWNAGEPSPRWTGEPPERLEPGVVLADMQLALWPVEALTRALPAKLRLEQAGDTRLLWRGETLIWLRISEGEDPWSSALQVHNLDAGYSLRITPLAFAARQP